MITPTLGVRRPSQSQPEQQLCHAPRCRAYSGCIPCTRMPPSCSHICIPFPRVGGCRVQRSSDRVGKAVRARENAHRGRVACSPVVLPRTTAACSCVLLTVPITPPAVLLWTHMWSRGVWETGSHARRRERMEGPGVQDSPAVSDRCIGRGRTGTACRNVFR